VTTLKTIEMLPGEAHVDSQADVFDWALDAMLDAWEDEDMAECIGGPVYPIGLLSTQAGGPALFDHVEVARDMLYRIEHQLADMAEESGTILSAYDRANMDSYLEDNDSLVAQHADTKSALAAAKRLAAKLRRAYGIEDE